MKKLYLHIGTGKTGSSSIQHTFNKLKNSALSFHYDMNGAQSLANIDTFIERLEARDRATVIYSNEWLFLARPSFIEALSLKLKPIFDVTIIIYIRRQDEFVISAYQQGAKSGKGKTSHLGPVALPANYPSRATDYYSIIQHWSQFFGKEAINIRVFSQDQLINGCAVQDFSKQVGVKLLNKDIVRKNESIGLIGMKLGHLINELTGPVPNRKRIIKEAPKSEKPLPSRDEALRFYNPFIPANKKLKTEFIIPSPFDDIFGNDFSKYPETRNDLWTESSANAAIKHILGIQYSHSNNNQDIDLIRDTALVLEKYNLKLSYQLMSLAKELNPDAPFIEKKLKEYENNSKTDYSLNTVKARLRRLLDTIKRRWIRE